LQSTAQTVEDYLAELLPDRRDALSEVRKAILENLPAGFEEAMEFGMIGYVVPLETYPKTYNGHPLSYASLASQKNHMSLYLMCIYSHEGSRAWFMNELEKRGKKLSIGKACIRFKRLEDLPLDLVGKAIAYSSVEGYIEIYETARKGR
jgi:uncharacterized protein YdhG (YjbR/CyaY superfamily)